MLPFEKLVTGKSVVFFFVFLTSTSFGFLNNFNRDEISRRSTRTNRISEYRGFIKELPVRSDASRQANEKDKVYENLYDRRSFRTGTERHTLNKDRERSIFRNKNLEERSSRLDRDREMTYRQPIFYHRNQELAGYLTQNEGTRTRDNRNVREFRLPHQRSSYTGVNRRIHEMAASEYERRDIYRRSGIIQNRQHNELSTDNFENPTRENDERNFATGNQPLDNKLATRIREDGREGRHQGERHFSTSLERRERSVENRDRPNKILTDKSSRHFRDNGNVDRNARFSRQALDDNLNEIRRHGSQTRLSRERTSSQIVISRRRDLRQEISRDFPVRDRRDRELFRERNLEREHSRDQRERNINMEHRTRNLDISRERRVQDLREWELARRRGLRGPSEQGSSRERRVQLHREWEVSRERGVRVQREQYIFREREQDSREISRARGLMDQQELGNSRVRGVRNQRKQDISREQLSRNRFARNVDRVLINLDRADAGERTVREISRARGLRDQRNLEISRGQISRDIISRNGVNLDRVGAGYQRFENRAPIRDSERFYNDNGRSDQELFGNERASLSRSDSARQMRQAQINSQTQRYANQNRSSYLSYRRIAPVQSSRYNVGSNVAVMRKMTDQRRDAISTLRSSNAIKQNAVPIVEYIPNGGISFAKIQDVSRSESLMQPFKFDALANVIQVILGVYLIVQIFARSSNKKSFGFQKFFSSLSSVKEKFE